MTTKVTQVLKQGSRTVEYGTVTIEEALSARAVKGHALVHEVSVDELDTLLRPVVSSEDDPGSWGLVTEYGAPELRVTLFAAGADADRLYLDDVGPRRLVTRTGWYESRAGGSVYVAWAGGAVRTLAWASDSAAQARYDSWREADFAAGVAASR